MGSADSNGLKAVMRDFDLAYAGGTIQCEEVSSVRLEGVGSGSIFNRIKQSLGRVGFELRCLNSSYSYWGLCAVKKT